MIINTSPTAAAFSGDAQLGICAFEVKPHSQDGYCVNWKPILSGEYETSLKERLHDNLLLASGAIEEARKISAILELESGATASVLHRMRQLILWML